MLYFRYVKKNILSLEFYTLPIVIIFSFLAWIPYFKNRFLLNRDDTYQIFNIDVDHLGLENIKHIFSTLYVSMYQPLSSLIYAFINTFWHHSPSAFHAFSILLHLINIVLVRVLIREFPLSKTWQWLIVIVFAIHPIQQEAIAWASAMSTLLFTSFYISALYCYIRYIKSQRVIFYFWALFCFGLGCFSKVNAITLPIILWGADFVLGKHSWRVKKGLYKLPFILISLVFGLVALLERTGKVTASTTSLYEFISIVPYQLVLPIEEFFLPTRLMSFYELPYELPLQDVIVALVILVFLTFYIILRPRNKVFLFGLLLYFANLVLVTGIFGFSFYLTAMRYSYLAIIGILLCLSQVIPISKNGFICLSPLLLFLWLKSFSSAAHWKNDFTIRKNDIKLNPDATKSILELANLYYEQTKHNDSTLYYIGKMKTEKEISPYDYVKKEQLKAATLMAKKDYVAALGVLEHLNQRYPNSPYTLVFLAKAYNQNLLNEKALKTILQCKSIFDGNPPELFWEISTTLYNVYTAQKDYVQALNTLNVFIEIIETRYRNLLVRLHEVYFQKALLLDEIGNDYSAIFENLKKAKQAASNYTKGSPAIAEYQRNINNIEKILRLN